VRDQTTTATADCVAIEQAKRWAVIAGALHFRAVRRETITKPPSLTGEKSLKQFVVRIPSCSIMEVSMFSLVQALSRLFAGIDLETDLLKVLATFSCVALFFLVVFAAQLFLIDQIEQGHFLRRLRHTRLGVVSGLRRWRRQRRRQIAPVAPPSIASTPPIGHGEVS